MASQPKKKRWVVENVGGEPYEYYPLGNYVVCAKGVCEGRPTFKYTRIEVSFVLSRLKAGDTVDDLVAGYRGRVPREALEEAIDIATRLVRQQAAA